MKTNFGANVSTLDSWKPVVVTVFDGHQERIDSVILVIDPGLSKDNRVVGKEGEFSWPIFGRGRCGRVNDPFFSGRVIGGGRL